MSNPNPPAGGPPLRALAMTLIALAIVFAGIGAMSLSSSSSDSSRPSTTSAAATTTAARTSANQLTTAPSPDAAALPTAISPVTTTAATTTTSTTSKAPAGAVDKSTPVHVLNNSTVQGLANDTANKLMSDGWTDVNSGNYSADVLPKSAVYYGNNPGEQAAAQAIATTLGLGAQPRPAGMADQPAGVIVILTGN